MPNELYWNELPWKEYPNWYRYAATKFANFSLRNTLCYIDITFSELKAFSNYHITLSICFPSAVCLPLKSAEFVTKETCMLKEWFCFSRNLQTIPAQLQTSVTRISNPCRCRVLYFPLSKIPHSENSSISYLWYLIIPANDLQFRDYSLHNKARLVNKAFRPFMSESVGG